MKFEFKGVILCLQMLVGTTVLVTLTVVIPFTLKSTKKLAYRHLTLTDVKY